MPSTPSTSTYVPTLVPGYQARPIRRSSKACSACKKAKARCNGLETSPQPCRRCLESGTVCHFDGFEDGRPPPRPAQVIEGVLGGGENSTSNGNGSYSLELRLARMEAEIYTLKENQARVLNSVTTAGGGSNSEYDQQLVANSVESDSSISLDNPNYELIARRCFDEYVLCFLLPSNTF